MRKININVWKVKDQNGKEIDESLLSILGVLVTSKKPDEMPRGYAAFNLFRRLVKAFEDANETKILLLDEDVYTFLRNIVEKDLPSNWGGSLQVYEAITLFMESKGD